MKVTITSKAHFILSLVLFAYIGSAFFSDDGICISVKAEFTGGKDACFSDNPAIFMVYLIVLLIIALLFFLDSVVIKRKK